MLRIKCKVGELEKVLKNKTTEEVFSVVKEDESGSWLITITGGKQYISRIANPPSQKRSTNS